MQEDQAEANGVAPGTSSSSPQGNESLATLELALQRLQTVIYLKKQNDASTLRPLLSQEKIKEIYRETNSQVLKSLYQRNLHLEIKYEDLRIENEDLRAKLGSPHGMRSVRRNEDTHQPGYSGATRRPSGVLNQSRASTSSRASSSRRLDKPSPHLRHKRRADKKAAAEQEGDKKKFTRKKTSPGYFWLCQIGNSEELKCRFCRKQFNERSGRFKANVATHLDEVHDINDGKQTKRLREYQDKNPGKSFHEGMGTWNFGDKDEDVNEFLASSMDNGDDDDEIKEEN